MNLLQNLLFVLTHSAYNGWAIFCFAGLGLWLGYVMWAEWAREMRLEDELQSDLLRRIASFPDRQSSGLLIIEEQEEVSPFFQPVSDEVETSEPVEMSTPLTWSETGIPVTSIFEGEGDIIEVDDDLGIVYSKPPQQVDLLSGLEGIDRDTAAEMNAAGIYTYKQLASLDETQKEKLTTRFNLPSDIWVNWRSTLGLGEDITYTEPIGLDYSAGDEVPGVFTVTYNTKGTMDTFGMRDIAAAASAIRNSEHGDSILIEGYCDVPGSDEFNSFLSKAWAQDVADHLVKEGIDRDVLEVIGHGSEGASSHLNDRWVKINLS